MPASVSSCDRMGALLQGSFETRRAKDLGGEHVRWEHKITWVVRRQE
jgi:hypothetical protein